MLKLISQQLRREESEAEKLLSRFLIAKDILFQHYAQIMEPMLIPDLYGKTIKVSNRTFPQINKKIDILSEYFEVERPQVFIYENYFYSAEVLGLTHPWIEISAKTLTDFSSNELDFLLGTQISFLKHKYFINKTHVNQIINSFNLIENTSGLSALNLFGTVDGLEKTISLIYYNWNREIIHTTDIYGLLCCGDISVAIKVILKMIINDAVLVRNVDIPQYISQKDYFNALKGLVAYYTKFDESVPYGPTRISRLLRFLSTSDGKDSFYTYNALREKLNA